MLLRIGELKRLHDWTENLKNWFSWLPDGIPLRAEHLVRLGQHEQALQTLIDLPARGLPIFSDGLSYAMNRLRLYISVEDGRFSAEMLSMARDTLGRLQRFEPAVDFSRPILVFSGIDPHVPDDEQVEIGDYEGLDVSPHMG